MSIQVKMQGTPEQRKQFESFYGHIKNRTLANSLMLRVSEGMLACADVTTEDLLSDVLLGARPDLNEGSPYTVRISESKTPYLYQLYKDGDWGLKNSMLMSVLLRAIELFLTGEGAWKRYSRIVRTSSESAESWTVAPAVYPDDEQPPRVSMAEAKNGSSNEQDHPNSEDSTGVILDDVEDMTVFDSFEFDDDDLTEADADQFLSNISTT